MELVDMLDSKSGVLTDVWVRVPPQVPSKIVSHCVRFFCIEKYYLISGYITES